MKFERVLTIYWSKGFLINGFLKPFNTPLISFFKYPGGYSLFILALISKRFEIYNLFESRNYQNSTQKPEILRSINIFFSQLSTVNNRLSEIKKYSLIKLLLIKSSRGRAHALGKPSRGQRTWSNAWTSYNSNKITRGFVNHFQKIIKQDFREEKRNYKLIQTKKKKTIKISPES